MKELGLTEYAERYFDAAAALNGPFFLTETGAEDARLPHRKPVSHKYSYGRALLIAGSRGFSGAPVLAANACERSGAGLTQLMVPESVYAIAAVRCDGAVVKPLTGNADGCAAAEALPELLPALEKADACVVGPGLGTGPDAEAIVRALLRAAACPLVLDADALTVCAGHAELFKECRAPLILTPHEGEFRRIGGDLTALYAEASRRDPGPEGLRDAGLPRQGSECQPHRRPGHGQGWGRGRAVRDPLRPAGAGAGAPAGGAQRGLSARTGRRSRREGARRTRPRALGSDPLPAGSAPDGGLRGEKRARIS